MSEVPEHPYRDSTVSRDASAEQDIALDPMSMASLHEAAWAFAHGRSNHQMRGHEAAVERLVAAELAGLPAPPLERQEALALSVDPGLLYFSKVVADAASAWAIADLTLLKDLDENALERAVQWADPAGLLAPFVANSSLQWLFLIVFDWPSRNQQSGRERFVPGS